MKTCIKFKSNYCEQREFPGNTMAVRLHNWIGCWKFLFKTLFVAAAFLGTLTGAQVYAAHKEILVEHIENYTDPGWAPLPGCSDTTSGLYEEFGDAGGWDRTWWANSDAWESDWKSAALPGGDDVTWADARDFGYFCGHGAVGLVRFTTFNTDKNLLNTDAQFGDVDLEYVTFDTSNTLQVQPGAAELDTWYVNAFQGLHLLIGWHDSPLDGDTGGEFADEMIDWGVFDGGGDKITTAWFDSDGGCTDQPDGKTQVVMAEILDHYNDYLPGQGSAAADAAPDGNYWIWSHDC